MRIIRKRSVKRRDEDGGIKDRESFDSYKKRRSLGNYKKENRREEKKGE